MDNKQGFICENQRDLRAKKIFPQITRINADLNKTEFIN